jgi:uncharacterized membrane protein YphA (DoxX/SURF4 family)
MVQDMLLLIQTTAAFFLALLFVRAALHKLGDRYRFQGILADYQLLPEGTPGMAAIAMPVIELATAIMLIVPSTRPVGAALAGTLLTVYAIAMAISLARGHALMDCGCGGAPEPISWKLVARNSALVALIAPTATGLIIPSASSLVLDATTLGIATLCLLVWMMVETLLANARRINEDLPGPAATWSAS